MKSAHRSHFPLLPFFLNLNLVKDQNGVLLCAQMPEFLEELLGGHIDPSLALDRLDNHSTCEVSHSLPQRRQIIQLEVFNARNEWQEGLLVLWIGRDTEGAHAAAVEPAKEGHILDLVWVEGFGVLASEFERTFVGFGAGVAEEDARGK